ncbi:MULTISPECIES: Uma2 family endonuclease [unclassified Rhizobium]|uniref:Uma2 family endonuclease n=1 Tax=unclassified Rhizobium TaxID=2613769 RepID=UPI001ADC5CFE|nr:MULTISPECIES: Uma2 family endonuclease [unclassified Rhizobium]MBO9126925.1 Uma2 family endonuclease [Rhizobium sp. 16-488-2b]MBO9177373.1 Uma2 family endonuclease [Rhizobium sp. 16-488-2a]
MPHPAASQFSEEEFFHFVQSRDERWELIKGEAIVMAVTTQRHRDIAANVLTSLHTQLRDKRCRPTVANTAISISPGTVRYPDSVVDCGGRVDQCMSAAEPTVVIDVLSPFTCDFDSHRKVLEYRSKVEIASILLIDATNACVLLHYRAAQGWSEGIYGNLDDVISLPEIGARLALSDIYSGLEFAP